MIELRKSPISVARDTLERQYKALLAGDLDQLSRMEAEIERAMSGLKGAQVPQNELQGLSKCAARNARLIEAARAGLARAMDHVKARHSAPLNTYDANGNSHATTQSAARLLARR